MRAAVLTCLLLAGCVSTPAQLVEEGPSTVFTLKNAPELAAGCMARHAEELNSLLTTVRRLDQSGAYEVIVRSAPDVTLAYAIAKPQASGSEATVWIRPAWFLHQGEIAATMTTGC
jgi:hypothetical protein